MFFEDLVAKMFKHHNHSIIATYEREGFALIAKSKARHRSDQWSNETNIFAIDHFAPGVVINSNSLYATWYFWGKVYLKSSFNQLFLFSIEILRESV